ncbi:hypothetical protein SAMN05443432_104276 [Roseovarius litoreus]|uniref:Uncharacterized protein n=1 Tax=Roseovarius litoreus TaxID=1155722 RepID=A0A1M7FPI8_9RHOB|nr:hypothetical protein [Roseovarius litoreus]SHM05885.1 hypothetical protein SAMN05443432_104276 [Roseovarius litoreus]
MKHDRDMVGAFPVSALDRLDPGEALVVLCLRRWRDGPDAVEALLLPTLGPSGARACLRAFSEMMGLMQRHCRRPLAQHGQACRCVGSDEAILAHFVMVAATGEREDAMLIASLLVDGPLLLPMVDAARMAGLYLYQAGLRQKARFPEPASATRH